MGADGDKKQQGVRSAKQVMAVVGLGIVTIKIGIPLLLKVGGLLFGRGKKEVKKPRAQHLETGPSEDSWVVAPTAAPPVPSDMKEIFTGKLACDVNEFYRRFVSGVSDWQKRLHLQLEGRDDMNLGPWHRAPADGAETPPGSPCNPPDSSVLSASGRSPFSFVLGVAPGSAAHGGFVRSVTFVQPKKPPQSVDAECVQRQQFCVYQGEVLVVAIAQNMLNIPFKDCFTVNICWVVRPASDGLGCTISVYLKVNFLKGVLVGGIIKMTTHNSNVAYWKKWAEGAAKEIVAGGPLPTAANGMVAVRGRGNAAFRAMHQGARGGESGGVARGEGLETMPVRRQLRFAIVVLLIIVGVVNQVVLNKGIAEVRSLLQH